MVAMLGLSNEEGCSATYNLMMSKYGLLKSTKHLHPLQNYSVCKRNKAISNYAKSAFSSVTPRASKIALSRAILVPGIWTSSLSHRSIFWPIDWIFRIPLVITWRPEIPAFLTAFPRTTVLILIVGIAHTKAFILPLASPPASKRHKGRITTDPLLTTRRFD